MLFGQNHMCKSQQNLLTVVDLLRTTQKELNIPVS